MPTLNPPYDPVLDAIIDYLGDGTPEHPGNWDHDLAPLVYENKSEGAPKGEPQVWVLVLLESDLYGQQTIGGGEDAGDNRWDEEGTLWLHVYTPRNSGTRESRRIGKALANMFRGNNTLVGGRLEFMDAHLGLGDPGRENGKYHLNSISIDWRLVEAE